jgi:predicted glycosyltransferase
MNTRPKILFYVQHLLGIGHLMRAGTLSHALESAGFEVILVSGGIPIPGFDPGASHFAQLSPTRATDKFFKVLVDVHDRQIDDAWKADRTANLLDLYVQHRPDIILIEMYPFGRRQMRFEIEPLIETARTESRQRPLIVSSVRDILVEPGKPERVDEMVDRVRRYFDLVLIHGDAGFITFDETFPRMAEIADVSRYTGYVADPPRPRDAAGPGAGEVIVSTGGGAVSDDMLQATIEARALSPLADIPWRVLVGHNLPEAEFITYRDRAPGGVIVERARTDFRQLLANCTLSISQGGYNTVMEILAAGTRAVCIPYAGGLESEQTLRCRLLADRGALEVVDPGMVTAENISNAITRALARPDKTGTPVNMAGAQNTATILHAALNLHRNSEIDPESAQIEVNPDA